MSFLNKLFPKFNNSSETLSPDVDNALLKALVGNTTITAEEALNIPAVAASVEKISSIVASVPFRLYRESINEAGIKKTEEITSDPRAFKINTDTGDLLSGYDFKKALVESFLIYGAGYAYLNKKGNSLVSIHFLEKTSVSTNHNYDPLDRICTFSVNGTAISEENMFRFLRKTKNGFSGKGVIEEINNAIVTVRDSNSYFQKLARTGGIKKGFLESEQTLDKESMKLLRSAWNRLYEDNAENVVILNKGLKYKEASQTGTETQLANLKKDIESAIEKVFGIYDDHEKFIKETIAPILSAFEIALNKYLLLESEKGQYYFAADTKELLKPTLLERANAYSILKNAGIMMTNEARYHLDLPEAKGGGVLSGSLGDVAINPETGDAFVFNNGVKINLETFEMEVLTTEGGNNE